MYENCENQFEKKFRELLNTGGYCKICIKKVANDIRKKFCLEKYGVDNPTKTDNFKNSVTVPKYNYNLLEEFCKNNNITLVDDYKNERLHANYFIKGRCSTNNCINIFNKKLHKLINTNSFCNTCIFQKAKEVRKETNIKKIGCDNYFQSEEIKNKIKQSNMKNYGVEYPLQSEQIKNKVKKTCIEKYGFSHHSYNKNVQNKITKTNLEKYGVEHLMKIPDYLEDMLKKSHKFKDYEFPSGRIDKIQGYEHFALNELIINEKMDESNIITGVKNVPEIWYNDESGKKHRYYVDIFIPFQNRCIEVKSTWTVKKPDVLLKEKAAKDLGYNYEIWVYDRKGNKICYD
jgi:hypothetical protein